MADETKKNKDLTVLLRISDLVQSPFQSRFEQVEAAKTWLARVFLPTRAAMVRT